MEEETTVFCSFLCPEGGEDNHIKGGRGANGGTGRNKYQKERELRLLARNQREDSMRVMLSELLVRNKDFSFSFDMVLIKNQNLNYYFFIFIFLKTRFEMKF